MDLKVNIKNLGPIKSADLRFRPITLIAGPNNSGKSFISRSLYSLLREMNRDHIYEVVSRFENSGNHQLTLCQHNIKYYTESDKEFFAYCFEKIELIKSEAEKISEYKLSEKFSLLHPLVKHGEDLKAAIENYLDENGHKTQKLSDCIVYIEKLNSVVGELVTKLNDPYALLTDVLGGEFDKSLRLNFQEQEIQSLQRISSDGERMETKFEIESLGDIKISKNGLKFRLNMEGLEPVHALSHVVYIESPVYWKLKGPLERASRPFGLSRRSAGARLTGIPQHFLDLIELIDQPYLRKIDPRTDPSRIAQSIGGRIVLNDESELEFEDAGGNRFSILNTAMGAANLGVLDYLIEREIIGEGSFVFLDEPEAHLHPEWQMILMDVIQQLSDYEITLIISTHSSEILKYIEVLFNENPEEMNSKISLNLLNAFGETEYADSFEEMLDKAKLSLLGSYADMFLTDRANNSFNKKKYY